MSENATFEVNDTVTISRGKNAGQSGTVQFVDKTNRKLALNINNELVTTTFSNVKAPDEPTITYAQLSDHLEQFGMSDEDRAAFFGRLNQVYDQRAVN